MEIQISRSNKVLLVCDDSYVQKANHNKGGTGTEIQIIENEIRKHDCPKGKFIPVIHSKSNAIPYSFKQLYAFEWVEDINDRGKLDELLKVIFDYCEKPPIGSLPPFVRERER